MKKSLLLIGILAISTLSSVHSVFASWNTPMWSEISSNDGGLCPVLRSACTRQKTMNASTQRILERYGRYIDFGTPEVCTLATEECITKTSRFYPDNFCTGYCPDGTTYNSCEHSGTAYPCRNHEVNNWNGCQAGTIPERICTSSYPPYCYTTCSSAPSECVGYCTNGKTYNICTNGPTYECSR